MGVGKGLHNLQAVTVRTSDTFEIVPAAYLRPSGSCFPRCRISYLIKCCTGNPRFLSQPPSWQSIYAVLTSRVA